MQVEQLYTKCLAQGAYYIESNKEVAIIDPLREVNPYIQKAKERGATIKYIFETHFHADFVSGHIDLSRKANAPIVYGHTTAQTGFDCIIAQDGQQFKLGDITLTLIHTPGHTLESSCILLRDKDQKPVSLFTGDTLFIGDVGRPDLAQEIQADLTAEKLAGMLYQSLHTKIMSLPDDIIIYPGHGAGSACGKNMSAETSDTLGHQKQVNYALRKDITEAEFIQEVTSGLLPPPGYFPKNVLMNIQGYKGIDQVIEAGTKPLSIEAFEAALQQDPKPLIIDTREAEKFAQGFIPGAINIGLSGTFAVWVGTIINDIKQPLLIVAEPGTEAEVITRLARVGYDNSLGYLNATVEQYKASGRQLDTIASIAPAEFVALQKSNPSLPVLDIRRLNEFEKGHLTSAVNKPLEYINENLHEIDPKTTQYVHCAGGYRSMVYVSFARHAGYKNLVNIQGGYAAITAAV